MCLCTGRVRRVYRAIGVPLIRSCLQGDWCCRVYKFISVSLLRIYRVVGVSLCRSTLMGDGRISMQVVIIGRRVCLYAALLYARICLARVYRRWECPYSGGVFSMVHTE